MASPTPLTRGALRRLASIDAGAPRVLSVFVNLDPAELGTREARESAVNSAGDELAKAALLVESTLDHDAEQRLRADVDRARSYMTDADLSQTQGLAVYAGPDELFAAFHLEAPVAARVEVAASPTIGPLVAAMPDEQWGVLLVTGETACFFRGNELRLEEEGSFSNDLTGNASRDQHSAEEEGRAHARRTAAAVAEGLRKAPVDHLVLGGPREAVTALREDLPEEVGSLVRGTISVNVAGAGAEELLEHVQPVFAEYEDTRLTALLGRVQEGVATGGRGVAQTGPVLEALSEQRVETLLLDESYAAPGVECERCGWLGDATSPDGCPADGGELREHDDISEQAIERALIQDANVVTVRERPELGPHGGIAAVLRF